MQSERKHTIVNNARLSSLPPNATYLGIIRFFDKYLPLYCNWKDRDNNLSDENLISQDIYLYFRDLEMSKRIIFMFHFQLVYKNKRSSDLWISLKKDIKKPILVVEAKRLYLLDKQYVTGNTGGIERFKTEKHGIVNMTPLPYSIMLGYIQTSDSKYWLNQINNWINELKISKSDWSQDNLLTCISESKTYAKYSSSHSRINFPNIDIIHYWLNLKNGEN